MNHQKARLPLLILEGWLVAGSLYLLGLLLAAIDARRDPPSRSPSAESGRMRLLVLVPAHDEQAGIAATVRALRSVSYPPELFSVVVIADNCSDETSSRAVAAGAEVLEREDAGRSGKGYALGWALERLLSERPDVEAVVIVDADCGVSRNLLTAMERRFRSGARALQVAYTVANPRASRETALRFAAFALFNVIRPLGKERLGLSSGLMGTGMGFTRELLEREPWQVSSLAEDGEYHVRLVEAGERVAFVADAWVTSPMPLSAQARGQQQARWESGKVNLARQWSPRLLRSGIAHCDLVRVAAGFEHLIPPQSLIAAGSLGCGALASTLKSRRLVAMAMIAALAQVAYVLGGLAVVRAPREVYRALWSVPVVAIRQLLLYGRLTVGRGPDAWHRTPREP